MNYALIFAGGTGQRMNTKTRPKQFLELHGKPIILYTIEAFENHPDIDGILVVCLEDWIPFLRKKMEHYDISKVVDVVPGGATGQESIYNGLRALGASVGNDHCVLIHDGVRPLVSPETISACIESVGKHGNAVSVTPAIETIVQEQDGTVTNIIDRAACRMAKAPQCFRIGDLLDAHNMARQDGEGSFIDSASLMRHYGHVLHTVETGPENIKITTPSDFYVFRAFVDARENSQIFGF
ncbi:2-C-methyl-D-erythritol 4-phosphate cytidylyltransferase [Parvibacter caecicola]|mgnify:CR=1 FL=1|uniref:2-C-methyl-D-erythritol 4-phosphate cytidylyltransferase n=1 Tax=Parvibacter caecicola TaxID=747645 RepID=UPI00272F0638|nr:2-C-methyl-D-erythritol 4-phosphate cytidylyltransferase [Parvibacter caecicola]